MVGGRSVIGHPTTDTGRLRRVRDRAWRRWIRRGDRMRSGEIPWDDVTYAQASALHVTLALTEIDLVRRIDASRAEAFNPSCKRLARGQLGLGL